MPCYNPVTLYLSRLGPNKKTGKWPLVSLKDGYIDKPQKVPCSRCIGCRLERSRQWAIRCMHEAQMHEQNCFLTLTYNDDELIYGGNEKGTLYPRHLQLFWKRLRKEVKCAIRYFACGEYGDQFGRPHYHAVVFGYDFKDKKFYTTKNGNSLYSSDALDNIWSHGHCLIGDVTFESSAYVARYIVGKKLGEEAEYYKNEGIYPEFVRMSRRPGIGASWYDKFNSDIYPRGYAIIRGGIKSNVPRYYANKYEVENPSMMDEIKHRHKLAMYTKWKDNTPERLRVRERVKLAQISTLTRDLE